MSSLADPEILRVPSLRTETPDPATAEPLRGWTWMMAWLRRRSLTVSVVTMVLLIGISLYPAMAWTPRP